MSGKVGRPQQFEERTTFSHTTPWRKMADRKAAQLKITRAELIRRATEEWIKWTEA